MGVEISKSRFNIAEFFTYHQSETLSQIFSSSQILNPNQRFSLKQLAQSIQTNMKSTSLLNLAPVFNFSITPQQEIDIVLTFSFIIKYVGIATIVLYFIDTF